MSRFFNVTGRCRPQMHYMVDLKSRIASVRKMVDDGEYFTINRARQFGKTTLLNILADDLRRDYVVVNLDFQTMGMESFRNESAFVAAFAAEMLDTVDVFPGVVEEKLEAFAEGNARISSLQALFRVIKSWCGMLEKPPVLLIDEVDTATNNQVFIDFLAQLRAYYLKRPEVPAFHSVILAGVYDVRNIRDKIRPDEEHKTNSPWNVAADFNVDMTFSAAEISVMLADYEFDYHTGMNTDEMANLIYDYTSGYPYLVSRLCKIIDERIAGSIEFPDKVKAWTYEGFLAAEKILVNDSNALFLSLKGKLNDYPKLKKVLYDLLFTGKPIPYTPMNDYIEIAAMFGFIRNENGIAVIFNRIFETVLYNWFMSEEYETSSMYDAGLQEKNQFVTAGHLNVRRVLERFVESFHDLYQDQDNAFLEAVGRRYFMLFLKPIINGVGNCYVEAETRDRERTDLVIDYRGEQYVIETKIWRGNAYNERSEEQLVGYLDYFHLNKGYMLSFNFNKNKEIGVKEVNVGGRVIVEAVV